MSEHDPWKDDPEDGPFDPDRPRYADVPLVQLVNNQITYVRGSSTDVPVDDQRIRQAIAAAQPVVTGGPAAPPDAVYGLFFNELGGFGAVAVNTPVTDDWRWWHYIPTRALLDHVSTAELAQSLTEHAQLLARAAAAGWQYSNWDVNEITLVLPSYTNRQLSP